MLGARRARGPRRSGGSAPSRVELGRRRVERDGDPLARRVDRRASAASRISLDRASLRCRGRARSRPRRRPPSTSPRSCSSAFSAWNDLGARSAALRRTSRRPTGTSMNSCRSSELSACAPPLITFIIGTGSVRAPLPPSVAVERRARVVRGRLRGRERDAEDRVRAQAALVRRAVELDQRARRSPRWSVGVEPVERVGDLAVRRSRRPA